MRRVVLVFATLVVACAPLAYLAQKHLVDAERLSHLENQGVLLDRYCAAQRLELARLVHELNDVEHQSEAADRFSPLFENNITPCIYVRLRSTPRATDEDPLFCSKVFRNDIPCMARISLAQLAAWR